MSATRETQLHERKASLQQVLESLPEGVEKVVERVGHIPTEGTGRYSGLNVLRRINVHRSSN